MTPDKRDLKKEIQKYSDIAKSELLEIQKNKSFNIGLEKVPHIHRTPFQEYYDAIAKMIRPGTRVLELGAGTGIHSFMVIELGGELTAVDISKESLAVLEIKFQGRVTTICADMVSIPLPDNSFDVIVSCGSLSYGDPRLVFYEVLRLLKPGGSIVFLDTLNHNWIYSLNRFRHYIQGKRTLTTLKWMPRMTTIDRYKEVFSFSSVSYYGKILWLHRPLGFFLNSHQMERLLRKIDDSKAFNRSAFKFLLVCGTLRK
jgi:ubiquinone/menaquinone biosynthesis C-methylase UbiE